MGFTSQYINESYEPDKIYRQKIIESVVVPGDEKYIEDFLYGEKGNIGEYKVIKYLGRPRNRWECRTNKKKDQITWRIRCSCGLEKDISHKNLLSLEYEIRRNKTKPHCRCPRHIENFSIGTEYDRLKIIGYAKLTTKDANRKSTQIKSKNWTCWYLKCTCKCGKHTIKNPFFIRPDHITTHLKRGYKNFGCGCKQITHGMSDSDAYSRFLNAKVRAKQNRLKFNLNVEDCIAPKNCPVLGIPLISSQQKGPTDNSPNLDRLIPNKGYTKENVIVISSKANRIKNSATVKELRLVANWLEKQVKGDK